MANKGRADIFVSIHINASRNRSTEGFSTYVLSRGASNSRVMVISGRPGSAVMVARCLVGVEVAVMVRVSLVSANNKGSGHLVEPAPGARRCSSSRISSNAAKLSFQRRVSRCTHTSSALSAS